MVDIIWSHPRDPSEFARHVLHAEAPEIPAEKLDGRWRQEIIPSDELAVNEEMVTEHDADPVHQARRDRFIAMIRAGEPLPPMIALGSDRYLVDGYARLRAARQLDLSDVAVIVQRLD